jgi:hypothetical protein
LGSFSSSFQSASIPHQFVENLDHFEFDSYYAKLLLGSFFVISDFVFTGLHESGQGIAVRANQSFFDRIDAGRMFSQHLIWGGCTKGLGNSCCMEAADHFFIGARKNDVVKEVLTNRIIVLGKESLFHLPGPGG